MSRRRLQLIIREPLLHFLLLGAGLFVTYAWLNPDTSDMDRRIILVERDSLLTHLQYRARVFDGQQFDRLLNDMSEGELQRVVDDYVREEALYREAKALHLDQNDYVARRRLIQQLEFVTRGIVDTQKLLLSDEAIQSFFEAHEADYYVPPEITFAHVFFSAEQRGQELALLEAQSTLKQLNDDAVPFDRSMAYGDRFLYHVNYVKKHPDEIASHFGERMQKQLFKLEPDGRWHGPFASAYGYHLVLVTRKAPGFLPDLVEIRDRVSNDARRDLEERSFEAAVQSIIDGYEVKVKPLRGQP